LGFRKKKKYIIIKKNAFIKAFISVHKNFIKYIILQAVVLIFNKFVKGLKTYKKMKLAMSIFLNLGNGMCTMAFFGKIDFYAVKNR